MSDVFISHSSKDKEIADKLLAFFEDKGINCWMAPRDIVPGTDWATAISTAITSTKVFVLIYSANSAESSQVAREVTLAENKREVFVVPYKIDNTPLKGPFEYYLTGSHFIMADYEKKDYRLDELYNIVSGIIGKNIQNITNNTYIEHLHVGKTEDSPKNIKIPVIIGAALIIVLITVLVLKAFVFKNDDVPDKENVLENENISNAPVEEKEKISPTPIENKEDITKPENKDKDNTGSAVNSLMLYINKYGNHFENDKGEYYSIKHSYGPVTVSSDDGKETVLKISRMYLTSYYNTSTETDIPLELGVYNEDYHLYVWLDYNTKTESFDLYAYEDEEKGKSKGIIRAHLNKDFDGKIIEEIIYEYNDSGWFGREEFIANTQNLLVVLCRSLEEDFSEIEDVSFESLGFGNWMK